MLAVVEDQQRLGRTEMSGQDLEQRAMWALRYPKSLCHRIWDEGRVSDSTQIDEAHTFDSRRRLGGGCEREPCLANATEPGHGQQPGLAEQALDLFELALAPDEARERCRQVVLLLHAADSRHLLSQHRLLQAAQLFVWLKPELSQDLPCSPVRSKRVRLPIASVQREHQLPPEALPQRILADQALELADEFRVQTERELRVDTAFDRGET
jgi:hypothetical protein